MGLKAFLLIVLAILLVITSEVAARKLVQRSITSSENGIEGGILPETLGVGGGVLPEVGGPSGVGGGSLGDLPVIGPIIGGLFP
ncbi:hypothetical protein H5410_049069 [Solanum commersonii]|uniref:Glycine-rich protein n=1 Tax=Solanum commersonii TaxID=4109 RepID=A0A9J5XK11_SOLCO|nr:hypothetical protein H5410_049069 [Solanum commersonii]